LNDQPTEMLQRYLAACERRDIQDIAACFAPDAVIRDPLGEQAGLANIRAYFESIYADLASLAFQTGPVSWCGASCAVSWKGQAQRHDGTQLIYEGIDVFTFDDDHRIAKLWAFWIPDDLLGSDNIK